MKLILTLIAVSVVTAASPVLAKAPADHLRKMVCQGVLESGSGLAGSMIGEQCSLAADTDLERLVQSTCAPESVCRVEALVTNGDPTRIRKVTRVQQLAMPEDKTQPYMDKVAERLDGILAPASAGCDGSQDTPVDRVSVQLNGLSGPAIQIHDKYCAISSASGDHVGDGGFQAVLRGNCAATGVSDADLRTGKIGDKQEIKISMPSSGPVKIDGEPLMRCPIRRAYTPKWWIDADQSFRGKYP